MTKQEINTTKKYIKSRIKTMQLDCKYTIYVKGTFFEVVKLRSNLYLLLTIDNMFPELENIKGYTKHNLINAMINEIERR